MATQRLSRLHQRILQWLVADHQRTRGVIVNSHEELVKALQKDRHNQPQPADTGGAGMARHRSFLRG